MKDSKVNKSENALKIIQVGIKDLNTKDKYKLFNTLKDELQLPDRKSYQLK